MKIKVGFGPKTQFNSFVQSGKKVAKELNKDFNFECNIFSKEMSFNELAHYDILIFIKFFPSYEILSKLKLNGKVLILDYQDIMLTPSIHEKNVFKTIPSNRYHNLLSI